LSSLTLTERDLERKLRHAWDVIAVLVSRDLKLLYKRSWLGFGWSLATPLVQLLVYSLVFRRVLNVRVEHYAAYVFTGVLLWGWFQSSLMQSTDLITGSRALVRQPGFPLPLLPYVTVGVRFTHFVVALPLLMIFLVSDGINPGMSWFALPLLIVVQFVFTVALAYPLASLNVAIRDTQHLVSVVLQLLMLVTPIFYSLDLVPPHIRRWFLLNPMLSLLQAWRDVLLHNRWPDLQVLLILSAASAVLLMAGRKLFVAQSHRFVEEL
jgi:homopolymeric O-antigen transport system permease protein